MIRRVKAFGVALLILSGCGVGPIPRECTAVGCDSGVEFRLDADLVAETEYRIAVCVDDRCAERSMEVPPPADGPFTGTSSGPIRLDVDRNVVFYSLEDTDLSGRHRVSLTVQGPLGELHSWEGIAEFDRSQPNGPMCEPVCWFARIAV